MSPSPHTCMRVCMHTCMKHTCMYSMQHDRPRSAIHTCIKLCTWNRMQHKKWTHHGHSQKYMKKKRNVHTEHRGHRTPYMHQKQTTWAHHGHSEQSPLMRGLERQHTHHKAHDVHTKHKQSGSGLTVATVNKPSNAQTCQTEHA